MQKSPFMQESPATSFVVAPQTLYHSDALPGGTKLGEFEITGLLGVGGFGMVYGAFDHSLQRTVAIKEFMPSALAGRSGGEALVCRSPSDQGALTAGLRSFVAEARLLAQFDHPSLVKVYRFWEANNTAYMAMPLYRGLTLKNARSQAQSPPPEAWLRTLLWSILGALKYLHEHNTVHRDISPDNIFLQDVGPPVLLDLGAARRAISEQSQKHTAVLKVNYAPIEQYADSGDMAQGPWTDLYALSAVVHGCLCNAPPLPAAFRVVRDRMPTIASVAQTVESIFDQHYSPEFVRALEHALAIQPQDRPQTVQAFIDEMQLTAPQGKQSVIWRDGLTSGGIVPVADSEAKTVLQLSMPIDHNVTAPATDIAPPEHISAYGVLEQDSRLLIAEEVPEFVAEIAAGALTAVVGPIALADKAVSPLVDASAGERATDTVVTKSADMSVNPASNPVKKPVAAGVSSQKSSVEPAASGQRPEPASAVPAAPATKSRQFAVAAVCAMALLAGAAYWFSGKQPATPAVAEPASRVQAIPQANPQTNPVPVAAPVAAEPQTEPVKASTGTPPASVPIASGAGTTAPKLAASAPARATSALGAAKKADTAAKPAKSEPAKTPPDARGQAPLTPAVEAPAPVRATPVTPAAPPGPSAAPAQPTPRARPGPAEICADRNFLVRPMCVFQECEKPEFAGLAFCVENKRQLERNNNPPGR